MNELSLFTGIGGGLLGTMLLGWRCVGAVEWESYPCRVLEQRQKDGALDDFPIWNCDIRWFNREIAPAYAGLVDVVTAGFPCQPFSTAGKRAGADDERNMWPATIECLRVVRPRFALLENVPGLISSGYFGTILGDLAESGYDARWRILSAAELGAPHKRDRLWIVATNNENQREHGDYRRTQGTRNVADADSQRQSQQKGAICEERRRTGDGCTGNTTSAGLSDRLDSTMGTSTKGPEIVQPERPDWWAVEPAVGRVAHGVAHRVDRLKALGNGQVPAVVRAAWLLLGGAGCTTNAVKD